MEELVKKAQRQLFDVATLLQQLLRQLNEFKAQPVRPEVEQMIENALTKKKPRAVARGKF